jgi:deoxyribodipyrimidine photo-lyase
LNAIEQQFYNCEIGKDYPFPIVDIEETRNTLVISFGVSEKKMDVKKKANEF